MQQLVVPGIVTEKREEEEDAKTKGPLKPPAGGNGMSKGTKLAIGMGRGGRGGKGRGRGGKGGRGR